LGGQRTKLPAVSLAAPFLVSMTSGELILTLLTAGARNERLPGVLRFHRLRNVFQRAGHDSMGRLNSNMLAILTVQSRVEAGGDAGRRAGSGWG
jgi:hypothetical protein